MEEEREYSVLPSGEGEERGGKNGGSVYRFSAGTNIEWDGLNENVQSERKDGGGRGGRK